MKGGENSQTLGLLGKLHAYYHRNQVDIRRDNELERERQEDAARERAAKVPEDIVIKFRILDEEESAQAAEAINPPTR